MKSFLIASAAIAGLGTLTSAGVAATATTLFHPRVHEVNARLHRQNARIDRAEASGKLTAQQASTLHAADASIKSEERTERSFDGGHLTKADKHSLNQQLNVISGEIGTPGHPRIAEVNWRLHRQDKRINRDEAAGRITTSEAATFHADDAAIAAEETTEEGLNDGHITRAEKRSLNQQVSEVGHQISDSTGGAGTGSHAGSHGSHK